MFILISWWFFQNKFYHLKSDYHGIVHLVIIVSSLLYSEFPCHRHKFSARCSPRQVHLFRVRFPYESDHSKNTSVEGNNIACFFKPEKDFRPEKVLKRSPLSVWPKTSKKYRALQGPIKNKRNLRSLDSCWLSTQTKSSLSQLHGWSESLSKPFWDKQIPPKQKCNHYGGGISRTWVMFHCWRNIVIIRDLKT